ncbi:MAG: hypothetical protein ACFFC7_29920 [Candidatus Hermodarchaeota archaeon]
MVLFSCESKPFPTEKDQLQAVEVTEESQNPIIVNEEENVEEKDERKENII